MVVTFVKSSCFFDIASITTTNHVAELGFRSNLTSNIGKIAIRKRFKKQPSGLDDVFQAEGRKRRNLFYGPEPCKGPNYTETLKGNIIYLCFCHAVASEVHVCTNSLLGRSK